MVTSTRPRRLIPTATSLRPSMASNCRSNTSSSVGRSSLVHPWRLRVATTREPRPTERINNHTSLVHPWRLRVVTTREPGPTERINNHTSHTTTTARPAPTRTPAPGDRPRRIQSPTPATRPLGMNGSASKDNNSNWVAAINKTAATPKPTNRNTGRGFTAWTSDSSHRQETRTWCYSTRLVIRGSSSPNSRSSISMLTSLTTRPVPTSTRAITFSRTS